jgi:hypothetical protein
MVTGFPATAQVNKAMLQNEVNFTGSSLPGYQTQVIPQIISTGLGVVLFQYPIVGPDGKSSGNPALEKQGIAIFDDFYRQAFGKPPSGAKFDALLLVNDISTKMQRGMFVPKGSPPEAVTALRQGFAALAKDRDFITDFRKVTGEDPDIVSADEVESIFGRIRNVAPEVKRVLKDSIGSD